MAVSCCANDDPGGVSLKLDHRIRLYVFLATSFVTALVVGDIIAVKVTEVTIAGVVFPFTAGLLPFPVTFLLTDLLNEFYGKQAARQVTWFGLVMAIFTIAFVTIGIQLPWAAMTLEDGWGGVRASEFDKVMGGSVRIYVASLTAYMIAQFTDIAVFNLLKRLTKNKALWLRATGSTVVAQIIDTIIVNVIAWGGTMRTSELVRLMIFSYVVKLLIAIALTPAIYLGHTIVERWLGIEPVKLDAEGRPIVEEAQSAVVA
jgi:queuosine precursor transporter